MANKRAQIYHNLSIMLDSGVPMLRPLKTAVAGLSIVFRIDSLLMLKDGKILQETV